MSAAEDGERPRAWWMAAGMAVWALHFAAIYGFTGLACARQWEAQVPWAVGGATLLAAAATGLVVLKGWRGRAIFTGWLTAATAALSLLAILWEGLSVLGVPPCGLR